MQEWTCVEALFQICPKPCFIINSEHKRPDYRVTAQATTKADHSEQAHLNHLERLIIRSWDRLFKKKWVSWSYSSCFMKIADSIVKLIKDN